jgi:hypothetical protein
LLLALLPALARAEAVALDMSACAAPEPEQVRALLALELHARLLKPDDLVPASALHVAVRCSADEARLALPDRAVERVLDLASVPSELRARLLALSIAELLQQAVPAPGAAPPALAPPPPPAPATPAPARAKAPQLPRFLLWGGLEASATPLFALGGSLLFRLRILRLFAWSSALGFSQGRVSIDRGKLRVQSVALRTGPALLLENAHGSLQLGLGARLGWLGLRGEPADADAVAAQSFNSWSVGPAGFTGGALRLGRRAVIALELELAHTLRRVRADVEGGGARTLGALHTSAVLGAGATW